jgi:septum formation topological specificity factor MinE
MGVGVRKYKFEYANTETIYKLRNDILEQMELYLPIERNYDINVYIEVDEDSLDNKKVIYVKFDILYKNNENKTFIIAYKNPENSGRLIAEIRI